MAAAPLNREPSFFRQSALTGDGAQLSSKRVGASSPSLWAGDREIHAGDTAPDKCSARKTSQKPGRMDKDGRSGGLGFTGNLARGSTVIQLMG